VDFRLRHPWDLPYADAVALQRELRRQLRTDTPLDIARVKTVAGADVAYEPERHVQSGRSADDRPTARFVAAVVVMRLPTFEIIEAAVAAAETTFPYIPGLLSFREGPALELAFAKLASRPDAILFDGQGIAHPRGLGLAAHLGLLLDCPAVGCAKTPLYGLVRGEPGLRRGSRRAIVAPPVSARRTAGNDAPPFAPGLRIGTLLRTRDGTKPLWVSCGHRINLPSAERLVLRTAPHYRLCEPIRAAHHLVNAELRRIITCDT
jgi:deoxyribonuclease V